MKRLTLQYLFRSGIVTIGAAQAGVESITADQQGVFLEGIPLTALLDAIGKDACKEHFGLIELQEVNDIRSLDRSAEP